MTGAYCLQWRKTVESEGQEEVRAYTSIDRDSSVVEGQNIEDITCTVHSTFSVNRNSKEESG